MLWGQVIALAAFLKLVQCMQVVLFLEKCEFQPSSDSIERIAKRFGIPEIFFLCVCVLMYLWACDLMEMPSLAKE